MLFFLRKTALSAVFFFLVPIAIQAALIDCERATCRITMPSNTPGTNNKGTGTLFEVSNNYAFVITCAHLMDGQLEAKCEFLSTGVVVRGRVAQFDRSIDVAVVAIPISQFANRPIPRPIPIAPKNYIALNGSPVITIGCPEGGPLKAFRCKTIGYDEQGLNIEAIPAQGRSGSALFDDSGTKIIGMIRAQVGQAGSIHPTQGACVPVSYLYAAFAPMKNSSQKEWRESLDEPIVNAQCGPGGCPTAGSPAVPTGRYLLPWNVPQQQQRQPQPKYDIPLPSQQQPIQTVGPPVDLNPLIQGQDAQRQQLDTLIGLMTEKAKEEAAPHGLIGRVKEDVQILKDEGLKGLIKERLGGMDWLDIGLIVLLISILVVLIKWWKGKPGLIEKYAPDSWAGQKAADLRQHFTDAVAPLKDKLDKTHAAVEKVIDTGIVSGATAVGGTAAGVAAQVVLNRMEALENKLFGIARDMPPNTSASVQTPPATINVNTPNTATKV